MTRRKQAPDAIDLRLGDCLEVLPTLDAESVDAVVTDPPYGLEFMGKEWDAPWKDNSVQWDGRGQGSERGYSGKARAPVGAFNAYVAGQRYQDWCRLWAEQIFRVLKPGGHLLAFGGPRTYHRLATGIEEAGFDIRDSITWLYATGFPKSLDVSKAIDKASGVERPRGPVQHRINPSPSIHKSGFGNPEWSPQTKDPITTEAAEWSGWGTGLKPAHEPIVLARKPFRGTVANNVLRHRTGALNIDKCRIGSDLRFNPPAGNTGETPSSVAPVNVTEYKGSFAIGRWPSNVIFSHDTWCREEGETTAKRIIIEHTGQKDINVSSYNMGRGRQASVSDEVVGLWTCQDGCPVGELNRQSGRTKSHPYKQAGGFKDVYVGGTEVRRAPTATVSYDDAGGASRFFYVTKASKADRNFGLLTGEVNEHPTVKPIELMRYLIKLITPPEGIVLDPFTGSGTTGVAAVSEGFKFIGIEREVDYSVVAQARINSALWIRNVAGAA
jgi:DNA modification methylase